MLLLVLTLVQSVAYRSECVYARLLAWASRNGHELQDIRFVPIHFQGEDSWLLRHVDGRLLQHPLMSRRHASRRPRLPNRWNKTRTTCRLRMEHRRNRRAQRTFVHATPTAPAIRAPRVAIPPW